jgi:predicted nucleotidyltransferase component of viral defense system
MEKLRVDVSIGISASSIRQSNSIYSGDLGMKDIALQTARESKGKEINVLREYLQNYLLLLMQKTKMTESLFFVGGTALRFIYKIRRYSEDMDFSAGKKWIASDMKLYTKKIDRELERAGYEFTINLKDQKTVQRMMIHFTGLLYELGFSKSKEHKFSVHIEVDLNPPSGWTEKRTIINIHYPVLLRHYDLPSDFAGKLAAVLLRPYTKGRDIFDLFWFRSLWQSLVPNLILLNNALQQKDTRFTPLREDNWLNAVREKIEILDWATVKNDVLPFLESEDDLTAFTREAFLTLY